MKKNVHCISGLGADKRVFQHLKLDADLIHLDWIEPNENDSIATYSSKLIAHYQLDKETDLTILAVSFGGLVGIEIAKLITVSKLILISSIRTKSDLPKLYTSFGKLDISKKLPESFFVPPKSFANFIFKAKNKKELEAIIEDTDPKFAKWASNALTQWDNKVIVPNSVLISGGKDKMLPMKKEDCDYWLKDGGHFMIVDLSEEIEKIINIELNRNY